MANTMAVILLPTPSKPEKRSAWGILFFLRSVANTRLGLCWPMIDSKSGMAADPNTHHKSTRSFNSLPDLKKGSFFGFMTTLSPVFGFLPV